MSRLPSKPMAQGRSMLDRALDPGALTAHFQPVMRLQTREVVAYEGLIRSTLAGATLTPVDLLDLARSRGRLAEFELTAVQCIAHAFVERALPGRLLVNLSARVILRDDLCAEDVLEALRVPGLDASRVTIELTERDVVENAAELAHRLGFLRARGVRVALDDFGNGHSNFEMWNEIHPEVVKIDRYLIHGLSRSAEKLAIVRALCSVAETLGADLIGEGVEDPDDLRMLAELKIPYAQGFFIGRPAKFPTTLTDAEVAQALLADSVPVPPRHRGPVTVRPLKAEHLLIRAPAVTVRQCNREVADIFVGNPSLHALAVVDEAQRPVGLINRRYFTERMAQPFARELFDRKSCSAFMQARPLVCDVEQSLQSMEAILRGEDQRYLSDGFIVTRQGGYEGLGTGESLVRRVTELRIEAARYANPLTFLPGNIPLTQHLARLLAARRPFAVAYFDLDHFKPFNDQYGYFRGDEMIRLLAETLTGQHVGRDFVGHVGGDDFVMLFQSRDWLERCRAMREAFNARALDLFDEADRQRGGIEAEDRHGRGSFFPLTTVSVGAVCVSDVYPDNPEAVASMAAQAKRIAKRRDDGIHIVSLRSELHEDAEPNGADALEV
ncbi:GGDEF domain-containing protein [Oleiagrimonas sp. C23AA]|uniref:GGDEF domain-containing protein n=1 Tax=Oleiagrimonas sp. C23AA TaxID=2719047 RepID=UPI0014241B91|nr:GGDEF domain-containing protein [Oleiagrimonas sp. C23AA]NII09327.1 GGDEF domain-containing protein [Oleiagrimonas sp. C23AA]